MQRIIRYTEIFSLFFLIFISTTSAQDVQVAPQSITSEKKRILILPATGDASESFSIAQEVTGTVASVAVQLGRFEVIDRNNLESILSEQALQQTGLVADSEIVELGKLATSDGAYFSKCPEFFPDRCGT